MDIKSYVSVNKNQIGMLSLKLTAKRKHVLPKKWYKNIKFKTPRIAI